MGVSSSLQQLDCLACLEKGFNNVNQIVEDENVKAKRERKDMLTKGDRFMRSALLGLSSQELHISLNANGIILNWKTLTASMLYKLECGEIDLATIKTIKMNGAAGLSFISHHDDKSVFDIIANDSKIRDQWVLSINELLEDCKSDPTFKPKTPFRVREEELREREKINNEKKLKFSSGGMKYVALAMANRNAAST